MNARETRLIVFANIDAQWAPCGQLGLSEQGSHVVASSFAYGTNYLKRTDALEVDPVSLSIADRSAVSGKYLLPSNALHFFGGIRDAAPDAWGRRVIEAKLNAPPNSLAESDYLLHAGSERVGALDIRSSLTETATVGISRLHSLEYLMEAAERIEDGLPVPTHLEAIFVEGTALGGARPKASVRDEQDVLWLAKFSSHHDRFNIPTIEYAALKLAEQAGLTVPTVKTLQLGKRDAMLIRRFDRYWKTPGERPQSGTHAVVHGAGSGRSEHRCAFVSGLTLVACDESESRDKSYSDLADAIRRYCHASAIRDDNAELFKRMVYNIFISNDDDHLRNHGFIWDAALPGWRLSPLYDVLPRASHSTQRYLHLGVGQEGRLATLDNAVTWHNKFTLSAEAARMHIADVWRVVREWRVYFEEWGVAAAEIDKIAPAFRHIDDISTPGLRRLLP